ncbi:NEDD4-binding protein 2-like 2 isoform 1-T1 [Dugong dugon]
MPYGEMEVKSLGHGEELISGPHYKRLKPTEEAWVFSHHAGADFCRIQEKTGNDWVPVSTVDFKGAGPPQGDKSKTTDLLKPLHDAEPRNRPEAIECVESPVPKDASLPVTSTDDGIYSTSKAFIGPVYKPPEKKKYNERRNQADTIHGENDKGGQEEKHRSNSKKSEIDQELFQFYKEIEELENEQDDLESHCQEPGPSQEQLAPYYQDHRKDLLRSDDKEKGELRNAPLSHYRYQEYLGTEPGRYPCDGQAVPTFCDISFTSFRPEWQSMPSFIVPRGPLPPPLPSFNYHLDPQRFNAPPKPLSSIFHTQDESQLHSGCYVNSCPISWPCLTSDQDDKYADSWESSSFVHPPRDDCRVHNGRVSNGFCEAREECWRDPPVDPWNGTDAFMNQEFREEKLHKLEKLLILLRGLPGSGKTTLSRILLGQSRDGIVLSTDDYFRYQDGYKYNVNQLGDAHDWNQNRAKQAIAQGRSPVIIDNTNTQAWEMKPYVKMAVGKGYRVEFHEPETWWRFDPEELEKRNKHGVSRKKIAQMLERYEYQMSISIVMNSVEPSHKSTQRPPPPQWRQRWGGPLGSHGHIDVTNDC